MAQIEITQALRAAVAALRAAQAEVDRIKPIVTAYQNEILAQGQYRIDVEQCAELLETDEQRTGKVITGDDEAYLMSDKDFSDYEQKLYTAHWAHGFEVLSGSCPLLTAEFAVTRAENDVLDSATYLTKFEAGRPLVMEQRDRALALILTLAAAVEAESVAA